jgi:hypothetical protein
MQAASQRRRDTKEHIMNTKAAKMAAAAFALAVITIGAAAPATAAVIPAPNAQVVNVAASAADGDLYDDGEPAGGTGIDPGPQTAPDVAGIPDQAGVSDLDDIGQRAGGTGVDTGPIAPPDTPSGPGLADGGEPAGAV